VEELELDVVAEIVVVVGSGAVVQTARVVGVCSSVVQAVTPTSATAAEPLPIVLMKARLVIMASPLVGEPYSPHRVIGMVPPWI
jgi:hypothetical protein